MAAMRNVHRLLVGNPREKTSVGRLHMCGNILLKWNLKCKV
jgi:hypothetical protein